MSNLYYQPAKIEDEMALVREPRDYSHPDACLNDEDDRSYDDDEMDP